MIIKDLMSIAAKQLRLVTSSPQREAYLLLAHVLQKPYEAIYFTQQFAITEEELNHFMVLLQRRLKHEPLSKIRETREFWSLPFRVTADTLDPRPDSETLIEGVLEFYQDRAAPLKILDLGTGTGCLLLSLLVEYPNAIGLGVDLSEQACLIAQENAHNLHLAQRAMFYVGDWAKAVNNQFDIIISNPPYISLRETLPIAVKGYDPALALYAGEDGLEAYHALAKETAHVSLPHSKLFLEVGDGQDKSVISIFYSYLHLKTIKDLAGKHRTLVFCMNGMPVDMA